MTASRIRRIITSSSSRARPRCAPRVRGRSPSGRSRYPDLEFRYDPIPPYAGTEQKFAAESGWGEVVNAKASDDVKAAAWKFIDFSHQDDERCGSGTRPRSPCPRSSHSTTIRPCSKQRQAWRPRSPRCPTGQWIGQIGDRDRFFASIYNALLSVDIGEASAEDALANAEQEINAMIDESMGP